MTYDILRGIVAASMPPWRPEQFLKSSSDGSWWKASFENFYMEAAGITPLAGDGDFIGHWKDVFNSRPLIQSVAGERPVWNNTNSAVYFPNEPTLTLNSLTHTLASTVAYTEPVSVFTRIRCTEDSRGAMRCMLGVGRFIDANKSHVSLTPRVGDWASVTNDPYNSFNTNRLKGANVNTGFITLSASRVGGYLTCLYIDGVLVDSNMPVIGNTQADTIYIFGGEVQIEYPQPALYVKDFIVAFKKAAPSDHIGYHQYALTLP